MTVGSVDYSRGHTLSISNLGNSASTSLGQKTRLATHQTKMAGEDGLPYCMKNLVLAGTQPKLSEAHVAPLPKTNIVPCLLVPERPNEG